MDFCIVTATVNRAAAPWVGGVVWFTLMQGSYAIDGHYPSTTIQADIRPDGKAIAALWNNEAGFIPTKWQCQMPDGESFEFSIPVGLTDATLEYLRSLTSQPPPAPGLGAIIQAAIVQHDADPIAHPALIQSMSALIDSRIATHNADSAAHPGLGGGGSGGGNPASGSYETTFTQSSLSIAHLLPIAHGLPTNPSAITIYDDSGGVVEPDFWRSVAANQIEVGLESFAPIFGLWRISVAN